MKLTREQKRKWFVFALVALAFLAATGLRNVFGDSVSRSPETKAVAKDRQEMAENMAHGGVRK